MAKNSDKTNVMRVLDSKKIEYISHTYEPDATMSGEEIASILNEDADKVFKTLITTRFSISCWMWLCGYCVRKEPEVKCGELSYGTMKSGKLCCALQYLSL